MLNGINEINYLAMEMLLWACLEFSSRPAEERAGQNKLNAVATPEHEMGRKKGRLLGTITYLLLLHTYAQVPDWITSYEYMVPCTGSRSSASYSTYSL